MKNEYNTCNWGVVYCSPYPSMREYNTVSDNIILPAASSCCILSHMQAVHIKLCKHENMHAHMQALKHSRTQPYTFTPSPPSSSVLPILTSLSVPWNSLKKGRTLNSYVTPFRRCGTTALPSPGVRTSNTAHSLLCCPSGEGLYITL